MPRIAVQTNKEFDSLLASIDRAGINSVRKLRYFLLFADHEGKSMAELAGQTKTAEYNDVQQAVIELSTGRHSARFAPALVSLGEASNDKPGSGRRKPIRLTAKGRRLLKRIKGFSDKSRS